MMFNSFQRELKTFIADVDHRGHACISTVNKHLSSASVDTEPEYFSPFSPLNTLSKPMVSLINQVSMARLAIEKLSRVIGNKG